MESDTNYVCRTCLSNESFQPIFEKSQYINCNENEKCISEMIMECTTVKILKGDSLPTKICEKCVNLLNQAYAFKVQCEYADTILRLQLDKKDVNKKQSFSNHDKIDSPIYYCKVKLETSNSPIKFENNDSWEDSDKDDSKKNIIKLENAETTIKTLNNNEKLDINAPRFICRNENVLNKLESCNKRNDKIKLKNKNKKVTVKTSKLQLRTKEKRKHIIKCHICNKKFAQNWLLEYHLKVHSGETPFMCDICGKSFRATNLLNFHIKQAHLKNEIKEEYICDVCNKKYSSFRGLKEHQQRHGLRNYLCHECGKGFIKRTEMEKHSRTHSGLKPFKCPLCDKSFSQLGSMKNHSFLHSGEKPFKCESCDRCFKMRHHLADHMRTHSGEKPFICTICTKSFPYEKSLIVHKKTHSR